MLRPRAPLTTSAGLVTVISGSPATPSWLSGLRISALGIDRFGQTGDLPDLYRPYQLDADAIIEATTQMSLRA